MIGGGLGFDFSVSCCEKHKYDTMLTVHYNSKNISVERGTSPIHHMIITEMHILYTVRKNWVTN